MSRGARIRRLHRWVSIVFTLTVIANFVAMAQGRGAPPSWMTYAPLIPLGLLLLTGLYLFVLPYLPRRSAGRSADGQGARAAKISA